ncbi:titin isoform X2 [Drosophila ananassae]|nr:titin isoform X2 [Drosophila ananassae]
MMKRAIEARAHKAASSSRSRAMQVQTPETPALETLCRAITPSNSNSSGSSSQAGGDGDRGVAPTHQPSKRVSVPIPPFPNQETDSELEPVLERTKPVTPTLFKCKDCQNFHPNRGTASGDEPLSKNFHNSETPVAEPNFRSSKSNMLESSITLSPAAFPLGTHLRKGGTELSKNNKPDWDSFIMPPQSLSEFDEKTPSTMKIEDNVSDYLAPIAHATGTGTTSKKSEPNNGSVLKDPLKQIKPIQGSIEPKSKNVTPQSQAKPASNPSPKPEPIKQPPSSHSAPKSVPFPRGRNPCIDGPRTGGAETSGAGKCKPMKEDPCKKIPEEVPCKDDPPKAKDDSCEKLDKEEVCQLLSKLEDNEIRALLNIIKEKVPSDGPNRVTKTKPKPKPKPSQPKAPMKADVAEKKPATKPKMTNANTVKKVEAPIKDSVKSAPSAKPDGSSKTPGQKYQHKPGELPPAPPSFSKPDVSSKTQPKPGELPRPPPGFSKPDVSSKTQPKPGGLPTAPPSFSKPDASSKTQPKPSELPRPPPGFSKPDVPLKTQFKPGELPTPPASFAMPLYNAFPRGRNPCRDGPRTGGTVPKEAIGKEDPCKKVEKEEKVGCEKPKNEPTCSELQSKEIRDLLSKLEEKLSCGFPDKKSTKKPIGELPPEFTAGDNPKHSTQEQNQTSHVFHMENVNKAPSSQILESPNVSVKVEVSVKAEELSKSLGQAKNIGSFAKDNDIIDVTASLLQDTANTIKAKNQAEQEERPFQSESTETKDLEGTETKSCHQPKEDSAPTTMEPFSQSKQKPKEDLEGAAMEPSPQPNESPNEDLAGAATKPKEDDLPPPPPSDCNALYGAFLRGRSPHREFKKEGPSVEYEESKGKGEDGDRLNKLDREIRTLRKMLSEERSKNSKFKDPVNSVLPTDEKGMPKCQSGENETSGVNKMGYVNTQEKQETIRLLEVEVPGSDKDGIDSLGSPVKAENSFDVVAETAPAVTAKAQPEKASKPESQRLTVYASPRFDAFSRDRNPCRDGPRGSAKKEAIKKIENQEEKEFKKLSQSVKNKEQSSQSKCPKTTASSPPQPKEKKDFLSCPKKSSEQERLATMTLREAREKRLGKPKECVKNNLSVSVQKENKEKMGEKTKNAQTKTASSASVAKEKPKTSKAPAASVSKEKPKPNLAPAANAVKEKTNEKPKEAEKTKKSEASAGKQTAGTCGKVCSFEVNLCKDEPEDDKPKLKTFPVAPLSDTLKGYLNSIKPLLTEKEFEKEVELTKEFEENEGADLQGLLLEAAEGVCNWLTPRWTTAAYLSYQAPVTVFSSPGMSFPFQKFKSEKEFLTYTAKAIHAVVEFKEIVEDKKMPTTKLGSQYLDNSQFGMIFGTVRTPGRFCDKIEQHKDSKYVVVAYKNNYYKLPVYAADGKLLHVHILRDQLEGIIKCPVPKGEPFGLLTHDNRGNWAEAYTCLCAPPVNNYSVQTIEESMFVVCLDEFVSFPKGLENVVQAHQLLHGGGLDKNSGNRWMDKTIQLIVNPNGMGGICYEHSPADCQPLATLMDFVNQKLLQPNYGCESCEANEPVTVNCLAFQPLDDCVNLWLCEAKRNIQKIVNMLQLEIYHYECHGKDFISAQGLCVDSYIQMALQLAYYSMHGTLPAQYESAHLRIFKEGRTDTIRSTCVESKAFVQSMTSPDASNKQRMAALQNALDAHQKLTVAAINGEGIDRHLFGLQQMALENELPLPEFFQSKGFMRSITFEMFTSHVATENDSFMVFGPLVAQGYGCCYNPQDEKIVFSISAWKSNRHMDVRRFGLAVKMSLESMRQVIILTGGNRQGENCGDCP